MDDDQDESSDEAPLPPRPWSLTVASLVTTALGLFNARSAEEMLRFVREAQPPTPSSYRMAAQHAIWAAAQHHRRGTTAVDVARFLLAAMLFIAALRVFLQVRASGWLWRQALIGNVAVTLVAAWYERSLAHDRVTAFREALHVANAVIASPMKEYTAEQHFGIVAVVSPWTMGLLAGMFLLALRFAMKQQTREVTG